MIDFPKDIDALATKIVRDPIDDAEDWDWVMYVRIARAIMGERERCAHAAKDALFTTDIDALCTSVAGKIFVATRNTACQQIERAIRSNPKDPSNA